MLYTIAAENTNIPQHMGKLKGYWECLDMQNDKDFQILDKFFKVILASLLPNSWDNFTKSYMGGHRG